MVEFYFDDSGTHGNSAVVLWAGLVGNIENFAYLDIKWREFLLAPSPGRSALRAFSLSTCKAKKPPYDGYDDLEIAGARQRVVQIIIDSGVSPIAYGIDRQAWDYYVGRSRNLDYGSPDRMAFGLCAKAVLSYADAIGEAVKMYFDAGQHDIIRGVANDAESLFPEVRPVVDYIPLPVASSTALQAADTIANEFHAFAVDWLGDKNAEPGPQLAAIIDGVEDASMNLMGPNEIAAMLDSIDATSR